MDKLIELLNEYDKINKHHNNWYRNEYGHLDRTYGWSTVSSSCWKVISKEYGFIKWLVDNDKIDRLTFCTVETPSSKYEDFDLGPETPREDYTNIFAYGLGNSRQSNKIFN